ncbi:MAG: bifunctional DNA-formamidopyrimidine glycosylase/DNA-(apurinic or apyrimidinic site) lyase [Gemmatimonadales bacterium]|nr:MAG: bifunctional DNA-formamidopyrimidine glycosylase/DNA-(apurinic or apyrimidinic site) lyase [Gemmatimonadales bacterium]
MPELPEAETIVRGLAPGLRGTVLHVDGILHPDVVEGEPDAFRRGVDGCSVASVGRRGKNIVLDLAPSSFGARPPTSSSPAASPGARPRSAAAHAPILRLVVNLGMSGRLLLREEGDPSPPPSHPAVRFRVVRDDGSPPALLVYHDIRRFGRLELMDPERWADFHARMGPEPLGPRFTRAALAAGLEASRMPLRSWLLDQGKVAGVGNIYASEAAWRARIHPARRTADIPAERVAPLHTSIRSVLREAVEARGTTLRDYRTAQGWEGSFGARLAVYGRAGDPCPRCRAPIRRIVFSNRSAFLCPRCQPEEGELASFETSAT